MQPDPPQPAPPRSRLRRALRALAWLLVLLPTALVLLALAGYTYLLTEPGAARVLPLALREVNSLIQGQVEVGRARLEPGGWLRAENLRLLDPQGRTVIFVERLAVHLDPLALAGRKVWLKEVQAERPELTVLTRPGGNNLLDAIALRQPSPESPPWYVELDQLGLRKGLVDVRSGPQDPDALRVEALEISGRGRDVPGKVEAALKATAQLVQPEQVPVAVEVEAQGTGLSLQDRFDLRRLHLGAGTSTAEATGHLEKGQGEAHFQAQLTAALARSLGAPLRADVQAQGTARVVDGAVHLEAALPDERGAARVVADVQPAHTPLSYQATATLDGLDPSLWLEQSPPASLHGTVSVTGAGTSLAELVADAAVRLGPSTVRGIDLSSAEADAKLAKQVLGVSRVEVKLPGGSVAGHGTVSQEKLDVDLTLSVGSLGQLTRALDVEPAWQGSASGAVELRGTPKAPYLQVAVDAPTLGNQALGLEVKAVQVRGKVPDLARPTALTANVRTGPGSYQQQAFTDLTADVDLDGRRFKGRFASAGNAALSALAEGVLPDKEEVLTVSSLQLDLGGKPWSLESPARIDLRDGARVDRALLRAGEQRLDLSGGFNARRYDAKLVVSQLDLGQLPAVLVPAALGLGGVVDGQAVVAGARRSPRVEAKATAHKLAVRGVTGLEAQAQATLQAGRVKGHLDASQGKSTLTLDADAPVDPQAPASSALSATVHAKGLDLAQAAKLAGQPAGRVAGSADLEATLGGTLGRPTGKAQLDARQVRVAKAPALGGRATLTLEGEQARLSVDATAQQAHLVADARLPTPEDPLRHPERLSGLETTEGELHATLENLALERWREVLGLPADAAGMISGKVEAQGTLRQPRGTAHLAGTELAWGGYRHLSGSADALADEREVRASARLALQGRENFEAEATLSQTLGGLLTRPEALGQVPVHASLVAGPLPAALLKPGSGAQGTLAGRAVLTGTLDEPVLHAEASCTALQLSKTPLGDGQAVADYKAGESTLSVKLPRLSLEGGAHQRLGLATLRAGIRAEDIPIQARLQADHFELASLAGLTETVHPLAGTLSADASAQGRLGAPTVRGTVDVSGGRVVVVSYGDYRDIALHADIDNDGLRLTQGEVHAGAGWAKLNLTALRSAPGQPFLVNGTLDSDAFPILVNDQHVASVQSNAKLDGEVAPRDLLINLHFSQVHADIPKLTRKDVQDLSPNPDIVILEPGQARPEPGHGATGVSEVASSGTAQPEEEAPARWKVRMGVFAPGNFWVRGQDINLDCRAFLGLQLTEALKVEIIPPPGMNQPSTVEVLRGHVDVIGRRFELPSNKTTKITFEGGPPDAANLDAVVVYNDRTDNVVVTVAINGPITHLNPPVLTSEPPMDSSQLALLIATGHLETKRGAGAASGSSQAASVVGAYVTSQLQKTLAARLPIDTLTVASSGTGQTRVEAGKYITDKIYVGYTHNLSTSTVDQEDQNVNEFSVQYQLSKHWQLEVVGGDQGHGSLEGVWSRDY